ncbi:unnamed protein product, partial [Ectocarpus fasciculatus]
PALYNNATLSLLSWLSVDQEVKVFAGHEAGVLHAVSNPYGNLLVSGGRDSAIRFWDVMSGVCVKTLR